MHGTRWADGGTSWAVQTRARRPVSTRRHSGTSRTLRPDRVAGGSVGPGPGASWAVDATTPGTGCLTGNRPGPAGWSGAGGAPGRCGGTDTGRGSPSGVRVVATVARRPGSTRAVRATLDRRATPPTGGIRSGHAVRTGTSRRTTTPHGGIRSGRRGASAPFGPVTGRRRIGRRLFSGGARRVGAYGTTTGGSLGARVGWRPGGPTATGALRGRVGYAEPAGRRVDDVTGAGERCGTPALGRRWAASAVDHRQARVGVRQATGLAQPVGGPLRAVRAVRARFAAGRRTPLRLVGGGAAATSAVGRSDGRRRAAVTAGCCGHRRRVARAGHHRLVGFGGAAVAAGCRAGTLGGTAAGGLRRTGVDRAWPTPGGTRVTVDGGVGPQAVRDRRDATRRRAVEPSRAGRGRTGGPRRIGCWTGGPATGGRAVGRRQCAAGLDGLGARSAGRRSGVRPAQRWHRIRVSPGRGSVRTTTGRTGGIRTATGRDAGGRRAHGWAGRNRRGAGAHRAAGPVGAGPRWAGRVTADRSGGGWRRRYGGACTGCRLHPSARRLARGGCTGAGRGWPVVRAAAGWRRLSRPGAVDRSTRGGTRLALARRGWSRGLRRHRRTSTRTGRRCRRTRTRRGRFGRRTRGGTVRRRRGAVRAQLGALLLGRAQVVDPAELLAGDRLLGLDLGRPPPTPATRLGAGIAPLVRALVRAVPTTRSHC